MTRARPICIVLASLAAVALAACGSNAIDESELEASVASQLAAETDQAEPNIDCPGDLPAEVGAKTECELSVDGDDAVYPVAVEVTAVEDGTASYNVEVGEAPGSGGEPDDQSSESGAEGTE